jgi:hypothetical protein
MRPRFVVALAGLIIAGILAGCGGGSSSSTTEDALSRNEFIAQGNEICAKGDKEIQQAGKKVFTSSQPPSQATQEKFVTDTIVPNIQGQIDAIKALPAPSDDEDLVNAITDAAQSALDKVKSDPSLITDQSNAADPFSEANKLANAYGLTKCGSDS